MPAKDAASSNVQEDSYLNWSDLKATHGARADSLLMEREAMKVLQAGGGVPSASAPPSSSASAPKPPACEPALSTPPPKHSAPSPPDVEAIALFKAAAAAARIPDSTMAEHGKSAEEPTPTTTEGATPSPANSTHTHSSWQPRQIEFDRNIDQSWRGVGQEWDDWQWDSQRDYWRSRNESWWNGSEMSYSWGWAQHAHYADECKWKWGQWEYDYPNTHMGYDHEHGDRNIERQDSLMSDTTAAGIRDGLRAGMPTRSFSNEAVENEHLENGESDLMMEELQQELQLILDTPHDPSVLSQPAPESQPIPEAVTPTEATQPSLAPASTAACIPLTDVNQNTANGSDAVINGHAVPQQQPAAVASNGAIPEPSIPQHQPPDVGAIPGPSTQQQPPVGSNAAIPEASISQQQPAAVNQTIPQQKPAAVESNAAIPELSQPATVGSNGVVPESPQQPNPPNVKVKMEPESTPPKVSESDKWRLDKKGNPISPGALYMRFYRSVRSAWDAIKR